MKRISFDLDDVRAINVLTTLAERDPQLLEEIASERKVSPLMLVALFRKFEDITHHLLRSKS